jgi:hypothetical protein
LLATAAQSAKAAAHANRSVTYFKLKPDIAMITNARDHWVQTVLHPAYPQ